MMGKGAGGRGASMMPLGATWGSGSATMDDSLFFDLEEAKLPRMNNPLNELLSRLATSPMKDDVRRPGMLFLIQEIRDIFFAVWMSRSYLIEHASLPTNP
jgi:hypothetical protein